jgi:hypothetical protein
MDERRLPQHIDRAPGGGQIWAEGGSPATFGGRAFAPIAAGSTAAGGGSGVIIEVRADGWNDAPLSLF